jgi:hypothetical protein
MRKPELFSDEIKQAVENPDYLTMQCTEHIFYTKHFANKGTLIVYAKKEDDKYNIHCADWLIAAKEIKDKIEGRNGK